MRSLNLNKIKDKLKNIKIVSTKDALKDVEPFFSKEEIDKLWKKE